MMREKINIIKDPSADFFGHSVKEFLCHLNGPTWIDISGQDSGRTRVFTTLLHGNEPSGVKALFSWLTDPERVMPQTNISFLVCSVKAALVEPEFSHRYLPGEPDINRCFRPPFDSANGMLAENILMRIRTLKPEAVIDVHNTSGSGPDFAISSTGENIHKSLASVFSSRLVITALKLGSLMEADVGCPIITLECGGSFDMSSDQIALDALRSTATFGDLFGIKRKSETDIYTHPLRFEIKENVSIGYGDGPLPNCDVTLALDIEKHNFGLTPEDSFLGWVGPEGLDYFTAIDDTGHDITKELFVVQGNKILTAKTLRLFMVTPRPEIAKNDCLFYLVTAD